MVSAEWRTRADWVLDGSDQNSLARPVADGRPIEVVCALIERDGRVLAARRPRSKSQGGKWEFPGGKLHDGESPREALVREIAEELCVAIRVGEALPPSTHDYVSFAITLLPFRCAIESGEPHAVEHEALAWCDLGQLVSLDWAAADVPIVAGYLAERGGAAL